MNSKNETCSHDLSFGARPFRHFRRPKKEQVPRPRSAMILGIHPPLPSTTDHIRRFHTEGTMTIPPHIPTFVRFAPIHAEGAKSASKTLHPKTHPWNVTKIPSTPPNPIERTHEILHHVSPSIIADRISSCLRDLSIAAVYDSDSATCVAVTSDLTKFYIRLFGYGCSDCKDENDNEDDTVLIEVQRRSGSSPTFHDAARIVLRAAKGLPPNDSSSNMNGSRPRSLPASILDRAGEFRCISKRCSQEKGRDENDIYVNLKGDLDLVTCLLHKDRLDAHLLALESLRFLTDEQLSGIDMATAAAEAILSDDAALDIKDAVLSLILHGNLQTDESRTPHDCEIEIEFNHAMHDHALAVLANAIGALTRAKEKSIVIPSERHELLSALSDDIANVEREPNDAYEASRCMNKLLEASDAAKLDAEEQGVLTLIEAMQRSGVCRHKLMEEELNAAVESIEHVV